MILLVLNVCSCASSFDSLKDMEKEKKAKALLFFLSLYCVYHVRHIYALSTIPSISMPSSYITSLRSVLASPCMVMHSAQWMHQVTFFFFGFVLAYEYKNCKYCKQVSSSSPTPLNGLKKRNSVLNFSGPWDFAIALHTFAVYLRWVTCACVHH